jgi:hypothetical protein
MNPKIFLVTSLIAAAAVLGYAQAPAPAAAPQPAPPADNIQPPAEPALAPATATPKGEATPDAAPAPKPKKRARATSSASKGPVRVETRVGDRDENGDVVIRRFGGEGAPGTYERRVDRLDNDGGPIQKEVRIYRNGNQDDVIVHGGPGGLRAEVAPRMPMGPGLAATPLIRGDLTPERVDHLEQAIRHLHAAGLDPLADRLQARVDRFHAEKGGPEPDRALREEINRLKEEHQKLQQEMRKLQKAIQQSNNRKEKPATE